MTGLPNIATDDFESAATELDGDTTGLTYLLILIRDLRADLATVADGVEKRLIAAMGDAKTIEVPEIGIVERKTSRRRTGWRHDELVPAIVGRIIDEDGIVWDRTTGERVPVHESAMRIAQRLRDCVGFGAGKVTGLRAIGVQVDEFCTEDDAVVTVKLPPREVA